MGCTYNVIDSDGHVLEPRNFWREYIDPAYRDRAPELIVDEKGKERFWWKASCSAHRRDWG
jgi:uncharacterized protein